MAISIRRDVGEERASWKGIRSGQASIRPPPASMQKIADRLAVVLVLAGLVKGSFAALERFTAAQWVAGVYLGIGGGALAFILWVMALARATPTRVANTMTVNPIAAAWRRC
ncbi:hypothetical protein GA0061099_1005617 [Bradyrhizobium yuanmingense]|uniref:Uncharacterized protein n=1 Tax=Bradyrhizobium yuanmingense TaxID=108015 RepID=A0A1C3WBJ7_9BRAD|nr:hypothetical protein [Bradyrhizobium yuanmingense]TWI27176.1 hypothetical protein IQ15_02707 [Bradyrhizobium yuanmingense]SCB37323.1 hypothetical protein GA0061099_1005617 [Bradyrhizobium yuanmingense]